MNINNQRWVAVVAGVAASLAIATSWPVLGQQARPASSRTALDAVHADRSADPISGVPDRTTDRRDIAAERARATREFLASRRAARVRAERRRRAERAARDAEPPARPLFHVLPPMTLERSAIDSALSAPVTPRASIPLPSTTGDGLIIASMPAPRATMSGAELMSLAREAATPPATDRTAFSQNLDGAFSSSRAEPAAALTSEPERAPDAGPSREQIRSAIDRVRPSIRACAPGQSGRIVQVRAVFAGTGRVSTAVVDAPAMQVTPRERSCMARAARAASLEELEAPRLVVHWAVRL